MDVLRNFREIFPRVFIVRNPPEQRLKSGETVPAAQTHRTIYFSPKTYLSHAPCRTGIARKKKRPPPAWSTRGHKGVICRLPGIMKASKFGTLFYFGDSFCRKVWSGMPVAGVFSLCFSTAHRTR
ncbi:MAG: hypothetical protein D6714_16950, partial [Bacteroidetes bacterium]